MIVGGAKIDLYIAKDKKYSIAKLKTMGRILEKNGKKTKGDTKGYHQLQKYLGALNVEMGILINFPFPPKDEPEIIQ